jgi:hypothetical protein
MAEPVASTLPPLPSPAAVLASEGSLTALVCPPDTAVHVASLDDGAAPVRPSNPNPARALPTSCRRTVPLARCSQSAAVDLRPSRWRLYSAVESADA